MRAVYAHISIRCIAVQCGPIETFVFNSLKGSLPSRLFLKLIGTTQLPHSPQEKIGKISFQGLQDFAKKHGGSTLGDEELRSIFRDFEPGASNLITQEEFLLFFAKVSRTITNGVFDQLVEEMLS